MVGGGGGVSGWECAGKLRTGGRVRRVWMVLDGSKEASLPRCGDKPSLALQQSDTFRDFGPDWSQKNLGGIKYTPSSFLAAKPVD